MVNSLLVAWSTALSVVCAFLFWMVIEHVGVVAHGDMLVKAAELETRVKILEKQTASQWKQLRELERNHKVALHCITSEKPQTAGTIVEIERGGRTYYFATPFEGAEAIQLAEAALHEQRFCKSA